MQQILTEAICALTQIAVLTLIPLIFFLFRKNKSLTFRTYVGFYSPTAKFVKYAIAFSLAFTIMALGLNFLSPALMEATRAPGSMIGKFRLMGLSITSATILLITTLFKTSLAEEIFFRGFIAKRLINKFGYKIGNFIQAFIFGILHVLLFWLLIKATLIPLIAIFIFTSLMAWGICYVQEKIGNGSIVPSWIIHGVGNAISYFVSAYVIQ